MCEPRLMERLKGLTALRGEVIESWGAPLNASLEELSEGLTLHPTHRPPRPPRALTHLQDLNHIRGTQRGEALTLL